jgi:hypothetical protein
MDMKQQHNLKNYWIKEGLIFHCLTIFKIMPRIHFMALTKHIHVTNPTTYMREKVLPEYDKLGH